MVIVVQREMCAKCRGIRLEAGKADIQFSPPPPWPKIHPSYIIGLGREEVQVSPGRWCRHRNMSPPPPCSIIGSRSRWRIRMEEVQVSLENKEGGTTSVPVWWSRQTDATFGGPSLLLPALWVNRAQLKVQWHQQLLICNLMKNGVYSADK